MSEILTFNLPISISRERWDAIIREAARKVYTEGLVDPGEALMPEVAKAATAALQPPPGIVCGDRQQALPLPALVEPLEPAKEGGPDRPMPPGAWERLHNYIRARSAPTAALLAQKASITRWASDGHVDIKIAAPFARQFNSQPAKAALLVDAVREVFGLDAYPRFIVLTDAVINADDLVPPRAVGCLKRLVKILSDVTILRTKGTKRSGAYAMLMHGKAAHTMPIGDGGKDERWAMSSLSEVPLAYWMERRPDRLLVVRSNEVFRRDGLFEPWGEITSALLAAGAIIPRKDGSLANQAVIETDRVYGLMFKLEVLKYFGFAGIQPTEDTP